MGLLYLEVSLAVDDSDVSVWCVVVDGHLGLGLTLCAKSLNVLVGQPGTAHDL